jgi:hypothetical protein
LHSPPVFGVRSVGQPLHSGGRNGTCSVLGDRVLGPVPRPPPFRGRPSLPWWQEGQVASGVLLTNWRYIPFLRLCTSRISKHLPLQIPGCLGIGLDCVLVGIFLDIKVEKVV